MRATRLLVVSIIALLFTACASDEDSDNLGPDASSNIGESDSGIADAGLPPPDCSNVPVPSGRLNGNIGTSGATIIQVESNPNNRIDIVQIEFDHSGNWTNGTSSIPVGGVESSAANPVALALALDMDEASGTFARVFLGRGQFEVHRNQQPVVQGPFNPAEPGFFEASAVDVLLKEFHYGEGGALVETPNGCQFQVNGLRIDTHYFW
jgi:hypothetical protein